MEGGVGAGRIPQLSFSLHMQLRDPWSEIRERFWANSPSCQRPVPNHVKMIRGSLIEMNRFSKKSKMILFFLSRNILRMRQVPNAEARLLNPRVN
jgi:hypothetical protein